MQLAFDFCRDAPARPERPERLFFGLQPDAETSARIARLGDRFVREHRLEGKRIDAERLHVSLHHVGDFRRLRSAVIYGVSRAASCVSVPPFEISLSIIKSFEVPASRSGHAQRRPLVLLSDGRAGTELYESLGASMAQNGLRPGKHFTPHITLLYGRTAVPAQAIEPVQFTVRDFALIHSKLGLARHEVVGRWLLVG
jgi:2'-5' RNA ligase